MKNCKDLNKEVSLALNRIHLSRGASGGKMIWIYGTEAAMKSINEGRMAKFSKKTGSIRGNYVVCGKKLNEGDNFVECVP